MLDLETALARVLAALPPPRSEVVSLNTAAGRVLAETVVAPADLPPFDNSAMDGYAVRAAEDERPNRKRRWPCGSQLAFLRVNFSPVNWPPANARDYSPARPCPGVRMRW